MWKDEYETTGGGMTLGGYYMSSRLRILADSAQDAHAQLCALNPCSVVGYPPRKTGWGCYVDSGGHPVVHDEIDV